MYSLNFSWTFLKWSLLPSPGEGAHIHSQQLTSLLTHSLKHSSLGFWDSKHSFLVFLLPPRPSCNVSSAGFFSSTRYQNVPRLVLNSALSSLTILFRPRSLKMIRKQTAPKLTCLAHVYPLSSRDIFPTAEWNLHLDVFRHLKFNKLLILTSTFHSLLQSNQVTNWLHLHPSPFLFYPIHHQVLSVLHTKCFSNSFNFLHLTTTTFL